MGKLIIKNLIKATFCTILTIGLVLCFCKQKEVYARSATVTADAVNIRSGPGTGYNLLGKVVSGFRLDVVGQENDDSGNVWYNFVFDGKSAYIRNDFIRLNPDYVYDENFENQLINQNFPENYKVYLRELHQIYPNWIFNAQFVNTDFATAVSEELTGTRTLVSATAISSHKSTDSGKYDWNTSKWPGFDGSYWNAASKEITEYYMDPRNFLSENSIFQFEKHTFNQNFQSRDGLYQMIKGTFLDSYVDCGGLTSNGMQNLSNTINSVDEVVPIIENQNTNSNEQVVEKQDDGNVIVIGGPPTGTNAYSELDAFSNVIGPGASIPTKINTDSSNVVGPGIANGEYSSINNNTYQSSPMAQNTNFANTDSEGSVQFTYLPKGQYHMVDLIYNACSQANVNPYAFAAMILQEQGADGKTDAVSGTNSKFPGNYNYININAAFGNGLTATENGLLYVATAGTHGRPWNTKEKGIYGAASYYSSCYVQQGQDTFYLKKWNVQGDNMYKHQFMTNVEGGAKEGYILSTSYTNELKSAGHEFKIPVYNNMPENNCPYPTKDGSPNNKLKLLGVNGYTLTPTFNMDTDTYSLIVPGNVSKVYIQAVTCDNKASIAGTGNVNLIATVTRAHILVVAENKDQRVYTINITRQGFVGQESSVDAGVGYVNTTENNQAVTNAPVDNSSQNNTGIIVPDIPTNNTNSNDNSNINSNSNGVIVIDGPPMSSYESSNASEAQSIQSAGPGL